MSYATLTTVTWCVAAVLALVATLNSLERDDFDRPNIIGQIPFALTYGRQRDRRVAAGITAPVGASVQCANGGGRPDMESCATSCLSGPTLRPAVISVVDVNLLAGVLILTSSACRSSSTWAAPASTA